MTDNLPHAVICDVDGTVALRGDRGPYDYSTVHLDLPNKPIIEVVHRLVGDHREIILGIIYLTCHDVFSMMKAYRLKGGHHEQSYDQHLRISEEIP